MTDKEKQFIESIKNKIEKYDIHNYKTGEKLTVKDCLQYWRNQFVVTHYKDGSPDELIEVGIEIFLYRCSPLLFIEKYGTFDLPGVGTLSCKNLYYFQKEILKDFMKWKKIVLTKTRQAGLSTLTSLVFWWKAVLFQNEWEVIISKDGKSAMEFLEKIKSNLPNIPEWMGIKLIKNNAKGIALSNKTKIDSFARSKSSGRGCSPTLAVLDEAAFYQTNSIVEGIVSSIFPALSRVSGCCWIVSTPNGSAEGSEGYWYYKQVRDLQEAGGQTKLAKLYDVAWWEVLDYPGITPYKGYNEKVQTYINRDYFNHPEVKKEANDFFMPIAKNDWKNNDWLSFQMQSAGKVKYLQEILQNFVVTGNTVFSDEVLEKTLKKIRVPKIKDMIRDRPLKGYWEWVAPKVDHNYLVAVDVSKGSGDDDSCVQVIDMYTYEQCAEYSGKCTTLDLANYAYWIGSYYNFAYMIVESNSIGETTFSELYYNLNYPNLFKQKKNKNGIEVMTGWITSPKSREVITSKFIDFYYDDVMWQSYHPYSERIYNQMKYWIWKGGRPDHSGSAHDDNIMAMAIGLFNIADGIKKIKKDDDTVFIGEDGMAINVETKYELATNYVNSMEDKGRTLSESVYKKAEEDMYRNAGIDSNNPEAANIYKWLIS